MSNSIEISGAFFQDTLAWSDPLGRSVGCQVELWAKLGKAVEPYLEVRTDLAPEEFVPLPQLLGTVNAPEGMQRLQEVLAKRPFPHYEPVPGSRHLLVRIEEDGTRTTGRFVDGQFLAQTGSDS